MKRHVQTHNINDTKILSKSDLIIDVQNTCMKVAEGNLYSESIRYELKTYGENYFGNEDSCSLLLSHIPTLLVDQKEKFYSQYYMDIVKNSNNYFPELSSKSSKVLAMKLCDVILNHNLTEKIVEEEIMTRNLSERELFGLQYLGGYVLQKIYTKLRNSLHYEKEENKQSIAVLLSAKLEDPTKLVNLKLVSALDRGGLWPITENMQRIFVIAEKYFSIRAEKCSTSINREDIVKCICANSHVKVFFENVCSNCSIDVDKEVSKNTLEAVIDATHIFSKNRMYVPCIYV